METTLNYQKEIFELKKHSANLKMSQKASITGQMKQKKPLVISKTCCSKIQSWKRKKEKHIREDKESLQELGTNFKRTEILLDLGDSSK